MYKDFKVTLKIANNFNLIINFTILSLELDDGVLHNI